MPVTPTYPGVYIEELPSAVQTIVGVDTSVTAFVGYTKRGPVNQATEIFSFGDFERNFTSLDPDCPLTYAVQQFFLNGGTHAWIVRVASGASPASLELANGTGGGATTVLTLTASSAGVWGNTLQITIDQDTINPLSLFNLTVTEYVAAGGTLVPGNSESFRNLTMNSIAPTYAVDTINNNSQLLNATRGTMAVAPTALTGGSAGTSTSGALPASITIGANNNLMVSVDSEAPSALSLPAGTYTRAQLAALIVTGATGAGLALTGTVSGSTIVFTDATAPVTEQSSVHFSPAPTNDVSNQLMLGVGNGGIEVDAIAAFHPMPTGTTGADLDASMGSGGLAGLLPGPKNVTVNVSIAGVAQTAETVQVFDTTTVLSTKEDLRTLLQASIQAAALSYPAIAAELGGATVAIVNNCLVITAGGRPDATLTLTNATADNTATLIGFKSGGGAPYANIAAYSPSVGGPLGGQVTQTTGVDGTAPGASDIQGDQDQKTGIYALENVDLFSLLVMPDQVSTDTAAVVSEALSYCEQRRAFMIVDLPSNVTTLTQAQAWIKNPSTPKSANGAAYFPRPLIPDPMQNYRPRVMPGAGAIAGLYARTDAARGVWKAPAGTDAALRGPASLQVPLTDMENGTINPLGLNATRSLPIYGFVVWGARTLYGADQMTSQWKYVPVRRIALYIEENLYRGTKWVVFEPNDEPLWAEIRLNVGSFMQGLFVQGAFEGSSPRQAYLVKCDSETTTQADIDLGVVNILVGFAPLKPAEFVVIQITQLAGQVET